MQPRHAPALVLYATLCCAQITPPDPQPLASFGTTVVRPFGLRGDIYLLPEGTTRLPDFVKLELKSIGSIYTSVLNVPPSNFHQGFPGVTDRSVWFAIDYNGRFWIEKPGVYGFGLTSDDGSKLYIDGSLKINNDGLHLPQTVTAKLNLRGGIHTIRVSYFQGPCGNRIDPCLALQLGVKPPAENWRIFSTDDFKPPPNPADWKFGDPSQIQDPPDPNTGRRKLRKPLQ